MNLYIYIRKHHKETPCVDILNKQKCLSFPFTKSGNKKIEQVLFVGVIPVGGGKMWRKG
jgi:hypothetical protein